MSVLQFTHPKRAASLSRAVKAGRLRRLAHGLYTDDLRTDESVLLRRHWLEVLAHYFPGAVVADRSASTSAPDANGNLFIIHTRLKPLALPGLTIVPREGVPALPDDIQLPNGVWLSSRPRALLENLRASRAVKNRPPRTLKRRELHDWIAQLRRSEGSERLKQFRARARELASQLDLVDQFTHLDDAIAGALGTRQIETSSLALSAAGKGLAYDDRCAHRFEVLAEYLATRAPAPRPFIDEAREKLPNLAFFEAYFSNFIEGTEFTVKEAQDIVFKNQIPSARPEDAHDILGTYRVVSDDTEMQRLPGTLEELLKLLSLRHARILEGRPEKRPGQFKERSNRVGGTEFVAPDLVKGTLAKGLEQLEHLNDPFSRAVYMMFMISEVHPFDDGNGRVARVMMNAELHAAAEFRIIIPTVYRSEYLSGLRALTHNEKPHSLVRVLDFAQRYTAQVNFSSLTRAKEVLQATYAFETPERAADLGIRLTLPSAVEH